MSDTKILDRAIGDTTLKKDLPVIIKSLQSALAARVVSAYVFGSVARNTHNDQSDIDILIVINKSDKKFFKRPIDFDDLLEIYPKMDILIYTKDEFENAILKEKSSFAKEIKKFNQHLVGDKLL